MSYTKHLRMRLGDVDVFYRESGPADAPVLLLPHGYPCSSYEFRNLLPILSDRWRLIAPDLPGSGYSGDPDDFDYSFDGYALFLDQFVQKLRIDRYVLYLHDFGSPIGARLAIRAPERVIGLIFQNADIPYVDALGPKYADMEKTWTLPYADMRAEMAKAITEQAFREEFLNDLKPELADRIPPDMWKLHWSLMTPRRVEATADVLAGFKKNREWFPQYRRYLAEHRPPALIVWGPEDHYMPEKSGRAYLRDLPNAEFHLLNEGGHWLLETHLSEVSGLIRNFLERVATVP